MSRIRYVGYNFLQSIDGLREPVLCHEQTAMVNADIHIRGELFH
ncbi:MAG: hypothetical protein WBD23_12630 [Candidatus Acidiferrales bacterium]